MGEAAASQGVNNAKGLSIIGGWRLALCCVLFARNLPWEQLPNCEKKKVLTHGWWDY